MTLLPPYRAHDFKHADGRLAFDAYDEWKRLRAMARRGSVAHTAAWKRWRRWVRHANRLAATEMAKGRPNFFDQPTLNELLDELFDQALDRLKGTG